MATPHPRSAKSTIGPYSGSAILAPVQGVAQNAMGGIDQQLAAEFLGLTKQGGQQEQSDLMTNYDETVQNAQTADDESKIIAELMKEYRNEV